MLSPFLRRFFGRYFWLTGAIALAMVLLPLDGRVSPNGTGLACEPSPPSSPSPTPNPSSPQTPPG
ncbi:MAG: hypothetical protein LVS60_09550 [Nodosilinea sp. LVE1205-7]